jgi:hypothetical protein
VDYVACEVVEYHDRDGSVVKVLRGKTASVLVLVIVAKVCW